MACRVPPRYMWSRLNIPRSSLPSKQAIAASRGKTPEQASELLDRGVYDMAALASGGWVDGCMYEGQVLEYLHGLTGA